MIRDQQRVGGGQGRTPYVAQELYLGWTETELPEVVGRQLAALAGLGLLQPVPEVLILLLILIQI